MALPNPVAAWAALCSFVSAASLQLQLRANPGQGSLGAQVQISRNLAGLEMVCEPRSPKKQRNAELQPT